MCFHRHTGLYGSFRASRSFTKDKVPVAGSVFISVNIQSCLASNVHESIRVWRIGGTIPTGES